MLPPTIKYRAHPCPIMAGCICDSRTIQDIRNSHKQRLCLAWRGIADQYFCICLEDRNDRLIESAKQFHKYGLCTLVTYLRGHRPTEEECAALEIESHGRYGCWTMHQLAAVLGLKIPKPNARVGVFEDDVSFLEENLNIKALNEVQEDFEVRLAWSSSSSTPVCHLYKLGQLTFSGIPAWLVRERAEGMIRREDREVLCPRLWKSHSTQLHAIIWTRQGMELMERSSFIEIKKQNKGAEQDLDHWLNAHALMYSCFPQLAVQNWNLETSNGGSVGKGSNLAGMADHFYRSRFLPAIGKLHAASPKFWDLLAYGFSMLLLLISALIRWAYTCVQNVVMGFFSPSSQRQTKCETNAPSPPLMKDEVESSI